MNRAVSLSPILPPITFAPEEAPIDVTSATSGNALKQRILACGEGSDRDLAQRRIAKYEAAAELNETSAPKRINKDCSADGCPGAFYSCNATRCSGTTRAPQGVSYVASYGRSQFIGATLVDQLIGTYPTFTEAERTSLGMGPNTLTQLTQARARAVQMQQWFNNIRAVASYADAATAWDHLAPAQRTRFTAQTGLAEQAYEDVVRMKTSPPTNSNGQDLLDDARQALVTAAIMSDPDMRTLLMGIFQDFDRFTVMAHQLMRDNMDLVLQRFPNAGEEEIAKRVARLHNSGRGGNWEAQVTTDLTRRDNFDYVKRFIGDRRDEGEWRSLRCTNGFGPTATTVAPGTQGRGGGGLELTPLRPD